jgi:hypothetical protein
VSAAEQTADACDMFFLLIEKFQKGDPDLKFFAMAACAQMRAGLASIIVNLKQKGGSPEITRRIEEIANAVYAKIGLIREAADLDGVQAPPVADEAPAPKPKLTNLINMKRNAADLVNRRERELREAQEEVKKLNRAMARKF